jgi:hypothetical protein
MMEEEDEFELDPDWLREDQEALDDLEEEEGNYDR